MRYKLARTPRVGKVRRLWDGASLTAIAIWANRWKRSGLRQGRARIFFGARIRGWPGRAPVGTFWSACRAGEVKRNRLWCLMANGGLRCALPAPRLLGALPDTGAVIAERRVSLAPHSLAE